MQANLELPEDVARAVAAAEAAESWPAAQNTLGILRENAAAARECGMPICQDTGFACVFAEIGQDVHIAGSFEDAVNEGVRRGYGEGYLRKSVVRDPLRRENTGDNTPAALTVRLVPGDGLRITVAPKGFGSENKSALKMFLPSASQEDVEGFVVDVIRKAGADPCPPVIVGVGLGGTVEMAAILAKRALARPVDTRNADGFYATMEKRVLNKINALGIGPQGFGGRTTALAVNIETYPTHIAGLPCVVNVGCHATRHASCVL